MNIFYRNRLAIRQHLLRRQPAVYSAPQAIPAPGRKSQVIRLLLTAMVWAGLTATLTFAQNRQVTGTVADATGATLPGASVLIKGTTTGVVTDENGRYSIQASGSATLVFSYIGYLSQEAAVDNRTTIDIRLEADAASLAEVVVVGYTTQSKAKVTSAVSRMSATELKNTPSANPVQSLQGKMAGVSIPVSTGQPGLASANIIIRGGTKSNVYGTDGNNALGSNASDVNPLIVIDGVFRSRSEFNDINPNDIESVQVMKDAASIAIYGARGANGVIVVKTRTGKFNAKTSVNVSHRTTFEQPGRSYKYLNAADYLRLARTTANTTYDLSATQKTTFLNNGGFSAGTRLYTNKGDYGNGLYTTALYNNIVAVEGQAYVDALLAKGYQTMDDPVNPGTKLLFYDNRYQDMLWKTGVTQDNNVSISGGGDVANYNLSAGYTLQDGTLEGTQYKRYNALGNFGFKLSKAVTLDAMVNYQNVIPNNVEDNSLNATLRGMRISPLIRTFKEDGNPQSGESYSVRNWFHTLKYDEYRVNTERITSRVGLTYNIIPGLSYRPSLSYVMSDYRFLFMRKGVPDSDFAKPSTIREKRENVDFYRQLMVDQILQYDHTFNRLHNITALAVFNYPRNYNNTITIGSQRATNDYIFTINEPSITSINGVPTTNVTAFGTGIGVTKSASFFGQLQYDYDARYLLAASMRYDGFSNFAPGNKYATFPSVSGGWNIHRESFLTNVKPVSNLKLRASWGISGTSGLSYTDTYGGYNANQYAQSPGILRANLANPNLKWEKTEVTDIALDLGLFNNRVNLTVDWYNKLTKDRLDSKPLPAESPFSSIVFNNGILQNKGIEIELGAEAVRINDFSWRINATFARNNQKILKLPDNGRAKNRQGGTIIADPVTGKDIEVGGFAEGERPYALYVFQTDGVFATEEAAQKWNAQYTDRMVTTNGLTVKKHAGDYIFRDLNGDNIIDQKDVVLIGYRTPNMLGGIQNTFTYKGLSLRFNADYALGHMISNGALARALGTGRAFNEGAPSEALGSDIWQKEGDTGKRYARFSLGDADVGQKNYIRGSSVGVNNSYASDVSALFDKGDFLALRELTLAYDLPKPAAKKIGAANINVFASIYNLGYLSAYKGLNPEVYTGYDPGGYPRPRQISLGANLRF